MNIINELLERKHLLFRELKENMQGFQTALQRGDEAGIERLTREREGIIQAIDGLDGELNRAGFHGGLGGMVEGWVERIKEVWQEVFQLNLVCLEYAEIRCRDLKAEMGAMGRGVQGVKKYLGSNGYGPRFVDMVK